VVVAKQKRKDKWTTAYGSEQYVVVAVKGSMITVRGQDREFARDRSYFKKLNGIEVQRPESRPVENDDGFDEEEQWRAVKERGGEPAMEVRRPMQEAAQPRTELEERTMAREPEERRGGFEARYPTRMRRAPEKLAYSLKPPGDVVSDNNSDALK
jgi:hypothetical protein